MPTTSHPPRSGSRRQGFTLIELLVSVTILGVMLYSLSLVVTQGRGAYRTADARANLESELRRAIDRVTSEMVGIGAGSFFPDPSGDYGTDTLSFRKATGVTGDVIDWGPLSQLSFEYAEAEVDDGVDNNGNGLVDEGVVVLTVNVGDAEEASAVLCRNVSELLEGEVLNLADDNGNGTFDERGFSIQQTGQLLEIRLTLLALDGDGRPLSRTISTSMRLRN